MQTTVRYPFKVGIFWAEIGTGTVEEGNLERVSNFKQKKGFLF